MVQGPLNLYTIFLGVKNVTGSLKTKNYQCYIGKKQKNTNKKRKDENFEKQKKCFSFSCPEDHSTQKLGSYVKRCALQPVHTHRVTTEGTLSGFQDFSFNLLSRIGPKLVSFAQKAHSKFCTRSGIVACCRSEWNLTRRRTERRTRAMLGQVPQS